MNNDIQNLVNELNSTTPKTQMYMIQLCRSAINNLYYLTDTIEENISSLQNSVVANTSAISGLQSSIDVINTNLNAYVLRIEALEDKTSNISKNGVDTRFSNSVNVEGSIFAGNSVNADGDISGAVLESNNDNGIGRLYIDDDGSMSLSQALNSGTLITSGNISEYASDTKIYIHRISFICAVEPNNVYVEGGITIYNKSNTAMTKTDLYNYLMSLSGFYNKFYSFIGLAYNNLSSFPNAFEGLRLYNLFPVSVNRIDCYDSTGTLTNQIGSLADVVSEL